MPGFGAVGYLRPHAVHLVIETSRGGAIAHDLALVVLGCRQRSDPTVRAYTRDGTAQIAKGLA